MHIDLYLGWGKGNEKGLEDREAALGLGLIRANPARKEEKRLRLLVKVEELGVSSQGVNAIDVGLLYPTSAGGYVVIEDVYLIRFDGVYARW